MDYFIVFWPGVAKTLEVTGYWLDNSDYFQGSFAVLYIMYTLSNEFPE